MKKFLKTIKTIVSVTLKIALLILVILVLTPVGYFVLRAGQPMSMPEYGGRTYYELLAERKAAYDVLAEKYQKSHPSVGVKNGMCFQVEVAVSLGNTLPWAGLCAASELIPGLSIYGSRSRQMGCGQMGETWKNFPSTWWRTFEKLLYDDMLITAPQGPVPYCRIPAP